MKRRSFLGFLGSLVAAPAAAAKATISVLRGASLKPILKPIRYKWYIETQGEFFGGHGIYLTTSHRLGLPVYRDINLAVAKVMSDWALHCIYYIEAKAAQQVDLSRVIPEEKPASGPKELR